MLTTVIGAGVFMYGANAAKSQHDFAEELRGRDPGILQETLDWVGDQKEIVKQGLVPEEVVDTSGVEHALLHVGAGELFVLVGGAMAVASVVALKR